MYAVIYGAACEWVASSCKIRENTGGWNFLSFHSALSITHLEASCPAPSTLLRKNIFAAKWFWSPTAPATSSSETGDLTWERMDHSIDIQEGLVQSPRPTALSAPGILKTFGL